MTCRFSQSNTYSTTSVAIIFFMSLLMPFHASPHSNETTDLSCTEVLVGRDFAKVDFSESSFIKILAELRRTGISRDEILSTATELENSNPEFSATLQEAKLRKGSAFDDEDTISVLAHFQERFWNSLNHQTSLRHLRDSALDRELDTRGAPRFPDVRGIERLAIVSRMNRERIWERNNLGNDYLDTPWIAGLVSRLRFEVRRNTHRGDIAGGGILSSRQFSLCCGLRGYNSGFAFNHEFLRNDDNIFFFLNFNFKRESGSGQSTSEYGKHGQSLNDLPEEGWVSPFIMWPHEFHRLMEAMPLKSAGQTYDSKPGSKPQSSSHYDATPEEIDARSLLHQYDFTIRDFDMLVRAQLAKILVRNGELSSKFLIEKPDINQMILSELGLGSDLEFKVPTYLPKGKISERW